MPIIHLYTACLDVPSISCKISGTGIRHSNLITLFFYAHILCFYLRRDIKQMPMTMNQSGWS